MTEFEHRSAELSGVDFPQRLIELIVTPWEQEALAEYKGRLVREIFTRGAYDGLERRANRVRVNRDHDVQRVIGRGVAFHPSREEGLVGELRIAKTPLGDETLELAEEGILDASAEFAVMPGGETWTGKLRRISKAFLGGIALTPIPAYEGATVLSVRSSGETEPKTATPNLDSLEMIRLRGLYAEIDRKYSLR